MTALVPHALREADFYSKLSRIQDQVVAGKHPRLKISDAAIAKLSRVEDGGVGKQSPPQPSSLPLLNGVSVVSQPEPFRVFPDPVVEKTNGPPKLPQPTVVSAAPQSSVFDPVLPRKFHDPLRAELALKRQRIERNVQDAAEAQKGTLTHHLDDDAEGWEGSNTSDLAQILKTVKAGDRTFQIRPLPTNMPGPGSSSFDENSYYSSKANSWSSALEEGELEPEPQKADAKESGKELDTVLHPVVRVGSVQVVPETMTGRPSQLSMRDADPIGMSTATQPSVWRRDRDESYSPPPARVPPQLKRRAPIRLDDATPRGPRAMQPPAKTAVPLVRRNVQREQDSESYSPPSPQVPVIRNTIAAPLAPQPSRVSPLTGQYRGSASVHRNPNVPGPNQQAMAQTQRSGQQQIGIRTQTQQRNVSGPSNGGKSGQKGQIKEPKAMVKHQQQQKQQKLVAAAQASKGQQNRKRKADGFGEGRTPGNHENGKRAHNRVSRSPEPYIKQEPVSPAPFAARHLPETLQTPSLPLRAPLTSRARAQVDEDREPARRLILREDGRAEVESDSSRLPSSIRTRSLARAEGAPLSSPYRTNGTNGASASHGNMIGSPQPLRRAVPDSQDLRRVASMQYASQVSPSTSIYAPRLPTEEIRYVRAPSRQATQYEDEGYQQVVRYQQPTRYGSPMRYAPEFGTDASYDRVAMPPPAKKRIIVLDDGEEWLAIPNPTPQRHSIARAPAPMAPRVQYIDDPAPATPRVRYVDEYAPQQSPYALAQTRYGEQAPLVRRRQPEVINLEDEEEPQRMPPPRIIRRRVDVDEQLRNALVYQNHERSRAASAQVMPSAPSPSRYDPYQQMQMQMQYAPQQQAPHQERAYSVQPQMNQPQSSQPPQMFLQDPEYGRQPTYGQPRPDVQMW